MMDISFSNESCYMSASCSSQDMFFYSVPTSPSTLKFLREHHGSQTGPTTPRSYQDANSNLDGFEFETSRRVNHSTDEMLYQRDVQPFDQQKEQQQQRLCDDSSLPTMAFADELFCDGKVIPLVVPPLKLPPRLQIQNGDGNNLNSTQSSTVNSPKSPGSVLGLRISRFWNDDFDPFTEALKKVREEEKRGRPKGSKHDLRRTRSLSPFRDFNKRSEKNEGLIESYTPESHYCDTAQLLCEIQKEKLKNASGRVNMLSESKGIVFARQVRQVEVANGKNFEPMIKDLASKVAMETKKDERKRGGFWSRNKMRENIKKFFFWNGSMSKGSSQHKLEDKKAEPGKQRLLKKHDLKYVT